MKNKDMPAMPFVVIPDDNAALRQVGAFGFPPPNKTYYGLSKREHIASQAMQGLLACRMGEYKSVGKAAVELADQLLEALEGSNE